MKSCYRELEEMYQQSFILMTLFTCYKYDQVESSADELI